MAIVDYLTFLFDRLRFTAGAFGFLTFTPMRNRPER